MATLVCFHAHPDDESIATAGTMALAARAGHEVVLVVATKGELGEPVDGVLVDGEALWQRREVETHEAARLLGVGRVEFLGYHDSGMMGEPTNDDPACFWRAPEDEAAERLASLLREVGADVLTVYDDHGGYGHPDHIQVHRVGVRAAALAGTPHVFASTMNRDQIAEMMSADPELAAEIAEAETGTDGQPIEPPELEEDFGSPEALITHAVDVREVLDLKREAMRAHRSQIAEDSFFLAMPPEVFSVAFGTEWYIELGAPRAPGAPMGTSVLASVAPGVEHGAR